MDHTHNRWATLGNKPEMWALMQDMSMVTRRVIKYVQYLGDDGEVGEVGEYFGEAGVISAGARAQFSRYFVAAGQSVTLTCYRLKGMAKGDQLRTS